MISRKTKRLSVLHSLCKSTLAVALVEITLAGTPTALHGAQAMSTASLAAVEATAQPERSALHPVTNEPENHVIKFDNSGGAETLEFRENLRQRQCVASVTPDFLTLAPGDTAEVRLDVRDSESSGCAGERKYVLWQAAVIKPGSRGLSYQILFTEDPREETRGGMQIRSTQSIRPGAPYAATCGDRTCFDEWVPTSRSGNAIFFYDKR